MFKVEGKMNSFKRVAESENVDPTFEYGARQGKRVPIKQLILIMSMIAVVGLVLAAAAHAPHLGFMQGSMLGGGMTRDIVATAMIVSMVIILLYLLKNRKTDKPSTVKLAERMMGMRQDDIRMVPAQHLQEQYLTQHQHRSSLYLPYSIDES